VPASPPFCLQSDTQRLFPDICAKGENGFIAGENCFVGRSGRNIGDKNPMISIE
jgi:hypothetical protein